MDYILMGAGITFALVVWRALAQKTYQNKADVLRERTWRAISAKTLPEYVSIEDPKVGNPEDRVRAVYDSGAMPEDEGEVQIVQGAIKEAPNGRPYSWAVSKSESEPVESDADFAYPLHLGQTVNNYGPDGYWSTGQKFDALTGDKDYVNSQVVWDSQQNCYVLKSVPKSKNAHSSDPAEMLAIALFLLTNSVNPGVKKETIEIGGSKVEAVVFKANVGSSQLPIMAISDTFEFYQSSVLRGKQQWTSASPKAYLKSLGSQPIGKRGRP